MNPADKTLFAIYLIEDEHGFVTVTSDHYGPGINSYQLGMHLLGELNQIQRVEPDVLKIERLAFLPRTQ